TLSVSNPTVVYNGSPQAAVVSSGSVAGSITSVQYNGSSTVPTNIATYAITANFTPTDSVNYNNLTAASAGTFQITAATQTASIGNPTVTYNTSPQAAAVTCSGGGAVSNARYNGSGTVPTNAATYAVLVDCAANGGYSATANVAAGNFVISKATPTLSVGNPTVVYNGSPQAAVVSSGSVAGSITSVQYNGSGTVPTNAATYAITANFAPTDSTNYNSLTAASAGTFQITAATPTASIGNPTVTYNTSPQAAAVTCSGGGAVSNILYNGSSTVPTNAATYAVSANCAASANYSAATGVAAGNFVISKATPTLSVGNPTVVYNGSAQAAVVSSGSVTGSITSVQYNGSSTVPTNADTYAITANFAPTDSTNYNNLTAASAGTFQITAATPTASIGNPTVTYNTSPQAAAVTCSGGGAVSNILYNGSSTVPTNAATYAVSANCAASANYS